MSDTGEAVQKLVAPFTAYDIFGYLAPGATLLLTIGLIEAFLRRTAGIAHTPLRSSFELLRPTDSSKQLLETTVITLALVAASYILGHIVASLSSLFLDRILVYKGYGYPYANLLQMQGELTGIQSWSGYFYRGAFFWLNFYLVARFLASVGALLFIESVTMICRLAAMGSGLLLISFIIAKVVVSSKQSTSEPQFHASIVTAFRRFAALYDGPANTLAGVLNTRRAFDATFRETYRRSFEKQFGIEADSAGTNNFWFTYCHVLSSSGKYGSMLSNWLSSYSFARNLSTAFYCGFIYCFLTLVIQVEQFEHASLYERKIIVAVPLVVLALACVLLIRYYYVYTCYFTKFVIRAFVLLDPQMAEHMRLAGKAPMVDELVKSS